MSEKYKRDLEELKEHLNKQPKEEVPPTYEHGDLPLQNQIYRLHHTMEAINTTVRGYVKDQDELHQTYMNNYHECIEKIAALEKRVKELEDTPTGLTPTRKVTE